MRKPAAEPGGTSIKQTVQRDDSKVFRGTKVQFPLGEEEEPVKIKAGRKGVQTFECENPGFKFLRGHSDESWINGLMDRRIHGMTAVIH